MVNFALNLFGKELKEINAEDLNVYFAQARSEADNLEFKSFPANAELDNSIAKILKTICAFLNSAGGLIIWGAPVGTRPAGAAEDVFTGALTPVNPVKGQDWLINKVSSSISPMPKDVRIQIVETNGRAVYLFEVQESQFKPHQFEHIYQIRLDGQNRPAPHFLVQALMREIKYPDIRGIVGFRTAIQFDQGIQLPLRIGFFNFSPFQNEFDVNFRIVVVGATFYNWDENLDNNVVYEMNGGGLRHKAFAQPLYFGMPHVKGYRLWVQNGVEEVTVLLSFGGRFSPAKTSLYKLNMANLNYEQPSQSLVLCEENELFQEKQPVDETIASFKNNPI